MRISDWSSDVCSSDLGKGEHDSAFAGIEYRARDLVVEAEASGHRYGYGSKLGARLSATADINDHWQLGATGEVLSRDTPLRALHNGIKADGLSVFARWHETERREIRASSQDRKSTRLNSSH